MQIGLAFLPVALAVGALSVDVSARLTTRFGARGVLLAGLSCILGGLVLFARAPVDAQYLADVLPEMVLLGLAVLATLSTARTDRLLAEGESLASALAGGYHLAFGIAAGLVLGAIIVAAAVLRAEPSTRLVRVVEDDFAERRVA